MRNEGQSSKNLFVNFKKTDSFFIQLTLSLIIIGLVFAFSSSTYESYRLTNNLWTLGLKQLISLTFGLAMLIFLWNLDYKFWYKSTWYFAWIMLVIMIITVFTHLGKASGGSQRWVEIGFFQFQPAEITKLAIVLLLTRLLSKYKWNEWQSYIYLSFCLAITLIIFKQPDLGSTAILIILILELFFLFEWPIGVLSSGILFVILSTYIYLKNFASSYQLDRILYWLHPYLEPQGRGYNLIQAMYAFGLGSLFGVGLGNSIQKQGHLPIPHSDFIFAIIGEEFGLIGATAILILYITWILRGFFLINKVTNKYGRILGSAIILLIATQAIINISVAAGLLPITGVTLPFFSCGGTSLIVTLSMCGILLNIVSKIEEKPIN